MNGSLGKATGVVLAAAGATRGWVRSGFGCGPPRAPGEGPSHRLPWPAPAPARLRPLPDKHLMLADGRRVRARPVQPADAMAERAFVEALSPLARRRRFHGALTQLPTAVAQAMTRVDFQRHVALVAEAAGADGVPRLVADARYVRGEPDDGSAEFALVVADDWQGLGLGRWLLVRLARHARAGGIVELGGSVLADNLPMLALMRSLGAHLGPDQQAAGLVRAVVAL